MIELAYPLLVVLIAAAYIDRNFWRVLAYAVVINIAIAAVNAQTGLMQALSFATFSVALFPVVMYVTIKNTRQEDDRKGLLKFATLISLPIIYILLTFLDIGDAAPIYLVVIFSMVCISTVRNAVRLMFLVYALESAMMLLSASAMPNALNENLASLLLTDFVTFLPTALLAYLTVRLYKNEGSLDIWQIS